MENYNYKDIGEFVNIGTSEGIKIKDLADLSKPDGTPLEDFGYFKDKSAWIEAKGMFLKGNKKDI